MRIFIFSFVLLLCVGLSFAEEAGTNRTISTTIEVTQTAINRYLNTQYNVSGFPRNISVTGGYTISLALPSVILSTGNAKLQMVFDVWQGSTLLNRFTVQPSINIPSEQISATQVQAFLTNLQATLDAVTPVLPSWVKTNIISNYDTRGWTVYPSKLLDTLSSQWFTQRGLAVNINNLALGWEVISGALKLTVSIPMTSTAPRFYAQIAYNQNNDPAVKIHSYNINVTVDEVRIYDVAANHVQTWTDDKSLIKGVTQWWYTNFVPSPTAFYFVWILFRTDNTFMVRKFKVDGQGLSSSLFSSIN